MAVVRAPGLVAIGVSAMGTAGLLVAGPSAPADTTAPLAALSVVGLVALAVRLRGRGPDAMRPAVLGAGAALVALAVGRPPIASGDVWSYAIYGRLAAFHHANPYLVSPSMFPRDPLFARVPTAWQATRSVYGPGFTAASILIARVGGSSGLVDRLAFQLADAVALIGVTVVLVRRHVPTIVIAALVMNPAVIYWVVNGGHNDAVVGAALLVAALAAPRCSPWVVGAALAVALSIKAAAVLPALALGWWLGTRRGVRPGAVALGTAFVPVAAGYAYFGGLAALAPLRDSASSVSRASLWKLFARHGGALGGLPPSAVAALVAVLAATLVWRPERSGASRATLHATSAYLVGGAYVLPWYSAWALPLAAIEHRSRAAQLVFVQSAVLTLAYTYRAAPRPDMLDRSLHTLILMDSVAMLGVALVIIAVGIRSGVSRALVPRRDVPCAMTDGGRQMDTAIPQVGSAVSDGVSRHWARRQRAAR